MYFLFALTFLLLVGSCQSSPNLENSVNEKALPAKDSSQTLSPKALPLFKTPEGQFAIYFPTPPQSSTQEREVDIGNLQMQQWVSKDAAGQYYVVSCADYPKAVLQLGSAQELLKGVKARLLSNLHAQQTTHQDITLDSLYNGIAFQAQAKRQHWYLNYHLYLVNNRLYQLGIHSALGTIPVQDSLDFFGSFEVVE